MKPVHLRGAWLVCAEVRTHDRAVSEGLSGSVLPIHNPTFGVDEHLELILRWLLKRFGVRPGSGCQVEWIDGE